MSTVLPVTVIVLTRDEEANLPACLASVSGWAERIVVVDSGSVDRTMELARAAGAQVVEHEFQSHTQQWQWALAHAANTSDWVLGLDADQVISAELRASLIALFTSERARLERCNGFYLNRRQIFRGRWIRYGGYYPKYLLKLFRRSRVQLDPADLMDHHFRVPEPTARLAGDLIEHNRKEDDITFWLQKHVRYAELLAREETLRRKGAAGDAGHWRGSPDQRVRWLKRRWYTMPRYWRAAGYFLYRYFLRLGFLDGREGFTFHALQAFWLRLVVDVHLDQLDRSAQ
jgi:glycosyltransferase involved in cell wall biosynthesis